MRREYQVNSDTLLWNDFIKGNDDAFRHIYNRHVQSLFKYGCNFTHDEALVKDCIHDVFIDLSTYVAGLGSTNNIRLYLFKSLKRKIIKSLSKRDIFRSIDSESLPFHYTLSTEDQMMEDESEQQSYLRLNRALSTLSPRQKEAIYLKFFSELDYEEISKVMEMNYQSTRNLIFRGLEKLRESFPKEVLLFFPARFSGPSPK